MEPVREIGMRLITMANKTQRFAGTRKGLIADVSLTGIAIICAVILAFNSYGNGYVGVTGGRPSANCSLIGVIIEVVFFMFLFLFVFYWWLVRAETILYLSF